VTKIIQKQIKHHSNSDTGQGSGGGKVGHPVVDRYFLSFCYVLYYCDI